ncbi:MAG: sigma-54-dependent Fis family transcriptional regulator [Hyphomicrobiales bacterium]|nr:sigma-54-dependent Fis family transcriptional regulator [Hyphomicrobiales bacterium]MBV9430596.1 sigma-54-dependent Fis family transcriptional regulator [Hyphomicrobiales bacterium]MBV9739786.1 sigma-54-dependent Fis family transcriptional regulator [Hyphomicrobiales bacterium]
MAHTILIVDDEKRLAELLSASIADRGYRTIVCASAEEALEAFDPATIDLVISDLRMPGRDGRSLLNEIRAQAPDIPVVLITAYTSMRDAVEMVKEGAFDYISKPFEMDEILATLERALKLGDAMRENARLRSEIEGRNGFEQLVGTSPAFRRVIEQIGEVCSSRATVLLTGESGTGKEVVARAIHFNSPRKAKPFIAVNCAAIPEGLIESELFGHLKGAFTGAVANRRGRFADADEGTVFLDEIGEMPTSVQAKILRVLQERSFEPVGSGRTEKVDTRVIAATNRDLRQAVAQNAFREDLFYRLNVFPIALPALRERKEDIPALAQHFLKLATETIGKRVVGVTPAALAAMSNYHWPGNLRELQNCVERAVIVARGSAIDVSDLPRDLFEPGARPERTARRRTEDLDNELARIEKAFILEALRETNGVQSKAAKLLGINERSLWHRVKKLGIAITKRASDGEPAA